MGRGAPRTGYASLVPLLYYWRPDNHRRDLDWGAGYHLNQATARLHQIDVGDSLWAFTRAHDGRYALAAELVVRAKTRNPAGFRYGGYRLWGDLARSRYFDVAHQPYVEQVLRSLSLRPKDGPLGRSFQGHAAVRTITGADHAILAAASEDLPREARARLLPEERLEAAALLGGGTHLHTLIHDEEPGIAEARRQYLFGVVVRRAARLATELRAVYAGRCQICEFSPRERYGEELCESHHVHWLSRGGSDELVNLALLCPNHHRAVHRCDAPFDFADMSFDFGGHREKLALNDHLPRAA